MGGGEKKKRGPQGPGPTLWLHAKEKGDGRSDLPVVLGGVNLFIC